jgi:hypothetical protein
MSSTNRGHSRDTHISDYYRTHVPDINLFFNNIRHLDILKGLILDPCAGGVKQRESMSYPEALKIYGVKSELIDTIDIREDSPADIIGNYLELNTEGRYDVIITNPPFNIALDVIKKALSDVKEGGHVILLLRLNFFGSQERKPFWDSHLPKYCFVHSKRIHFIDGQGKSGTDSIEYAHYIWQKGYDPEYTLLKVI